MANYNAAESNVTEHDAVDVEPLDVETISVEPLDSEPLDFERVDADPLEPDSGEARPAIRIVSADDSIADDSIAEDSIAEDSIAEDSIADDPAAVDRTFGDGPGYGADPTFTDNSSSSVSSVPATASAALNGGDDERWHDIVASFIDDPRGSVAEAAELVEADVTALIAMLSRRRDAMGESWQTETSTTQAGGATEDLRLALRSYRDFSKQIAASVKTLS
jgi:hypothetical protein